MASPNWIQSVPRRRWELAGAVLLLLLAAGLAWRAPLTVPPGLEMDELIEAQIAGRVIAGDWRPFYEDGQGREGLYYYWLAPWLTLLGRRVFTLRFASTAMWLLGLAAAYRLQRRLFGPAVALTGLAAGGTVFWTLFAARSGLRSTSFPLLAAASAALFWRGLFGEDVQDRARTLSIAAAGGCLGLAVYAYTAARVLPVIFATFILYLLVLRRPTLRRHWRRLLLGGLVALLVALPMIAYLATHPGADQLAFSEFDRPWAALRQGDPRPALETTLATLGMFNIRGDPLIFDNVPGRPVFDGLTGLVFLAGLVIAAARFRRPAYAFALIWLVVSLIPGMLSQPAPNFYRTVGAQVVAFAFPGLALVAMGRGLARIWPRPRARLLVTAVATLLIAVQLVFTWQAYFVTWPTVEGISFFWQKSLVEAAQFLDESTETTPVSLCTVLVYERDPWWRPAWQSMPYLLDRSDLAIRYYDCRTALVFPAGEEARFLFPDPSAQIPAALGDGLMAETTPIHNVFPSGEGHALRWARPSTGLPAPDGPVWWAPEAGGAETALPVSFGDSLALAGYTLSPESPQPGDTLSLITVWDVLETPAPDLALFTHLLSDPSTVVTQQDGLGITSHSLRPGDRFYVLHDQIQVPVDGEAGRYSLSIGLYSTETLTRLPVTDGDSARGDRIFLKPVTLGANP